MIENCRFRCKYTLTEHTSERLLLIKEDIQKNVSIDRGGSGKTSSVALMTEKLKIMFSLENLLEIFSSSSAYNSVKELMKKSWLLS